MDHRSKRLHGPSNHKQATSELRVVFSMAAFPSYVFRVCVGYAITSRDVDETPLERTLDVESFLESFLCRTTIVLGQR